MRAHLIPIKGGGRPIQITRDITLVGRQDDLCDICLDKSSISKMHCLIAKTDGLLFIRDLGSTNGTKVNGQRVTRGALLPGDELAFASVKYRVHLGPGSPDSDEEIAHDEQTGVLDYVDADDESDDDQDDSDEPMPSNSDVRLLSDDSAVS